MRNQRLKINLLALIKKESPTGVLWNRQTFKIHMKTLQRGPF